MMQSAKGPVRNLGKYATIPLSRPPDDWSERRTLEVFADACRIAGIAPRDAIGGRFTWEIAFRRQYVYWLLRARGLSLPRIAQMTHRKEHTTVMYGIERFDFICSELGLL